MTTKKIFGIVVSILLALGLLVVIFAGGILLFVFHQVGNSDAAAVARSFLKNNERLRGDIGEVKDFGWFITGNINIQNGSGTATLKLNVIGEKKTVNATVDLIYRNGKDWRVTSAAYINEAGKTIELLNPYEARLKFQSSDFRSQITNHKTQIPDFRSLTMKCRSQSLRYRSQRACFSPEISNSAIGRHCLESAVVV